ncbi:Aconitate hydratase 2 (EC, partial [uncultured Gammaproteobacteria bacterium]
AAKLGRIPTVEEYLSAMQGIEPTSNDIYQYLNFDQISQYQKSVGHIALDTILKE